MKSRLGECLLDSGKVTRIDLDTALNFQRERGGTLGDILVELEIISERELVEILSEQLGVPIVETVTAPFDTDAIDAFSEGRARKFLALPIRFIDGDKVEVAMADPLDLDALEELERSTGKTVVVQISEKTALLETIETQYLAQSHRFAREAQAEKHLMDQIKRENPEQRPVRTIAVLSNKGGVGKTHLSVNMSVALGNEEHRTLLIDADLGTANVASKIGYQPKITLMHLLKNERPIEDIVVGTEFGFDLIAGQPGEYKLANLRTEERLRFLEEFLRVSRSYDVAVFDLSAGIDNTVLDFALGAHEMVVVTTPQDIVAGYSCLKALFYRFIQHERRLTNELPNYTPNRVCRPSLIINQVDNAEMGQRVFDKACSTVKKYLKIRGNAFTLEPQYLGYVVYDSKGMRQTDLAHQPYLTQFPDTKTAECYRHLAEELMKPETLRSSEVEFSGWFERFAGIFGRNN